MPTANFTTIHWQDVETTRIARPPGIARNPHRGWYWHYFDNGTWRYPETAGDWVSEFPFLETVFLRLPWCELEPQRGRFRWEILDRVIEPNLALGRTIAFNISCKETDPYYPRATPGWVEEAGARGRWIAGKEGANWEPDYGDPVFLRHLRAFHEAMAARYDGKPWVEWVDISSYGDWGEGHTQASSKQDWPVRVIERHFQIYQDCYRHSPLQANDDLVGSRLDRAGAEELRRAINDRGFQITDHSVGVDFFVKEAYGPSSLRQAGWLREVSLRAPVVLEYEHYDTAVEQGNWRGGRIFEAAIEEARATYAGFHGFPRRWLRDNAELATNLGRRLGYWLHLLKVRPANSFQPGGLWTIEWSGENRGVAPVYRPAIWECRLEAGRNALTLPMEAPHDFWEPEVGKTIALTLRVPTDWPLETTRVAIRMLDQRLQRPIHWENSHGDGEGWIGIGRFRPDGM